jgi:hypothetical protein
VQNSLLIFCIEGFQELLESVGLFEDFFVFLHRLPHTRKEEEKGETQKKLKSVRRRVSSFSVFLVCMEHSLHKQSTERQSYAVKLPPFKKPIQQIFVEPVKSSLLAIAFADESWEIHPLVLNPFSFAPFLLVE